MQASGVAGNLITTLSACLAIVVSLAVSTPAAAVTLGSTLGSPANGSVCEFESLEPETRKCTVGQSDLLASHTAPGGLVTPFDGVIVGWSVVSGTVPAGTGQVKLALRAMGPGDQAKGPEVELPASPSGTRHVYAERMSIESGKTIGLTISIANRSTEKAGAPIAFREDGVGTIEWWRPEPYAGIGESEDDVEVLLDVELEPDVDHDGYGDLTQDRCPNVIGSDDYCVPRDREAPAIRAQFADRQDFLKSGVVLVKVGSSEAGLASVSGRLEVKGGGGHTFGLRGARGPIAANGQKSLRLRLRKGALKAARVAMRDGKKLLVTALVGVADTAGNERQATVRVRPR